MVDAENVKLSRLWSNHFLISVNKLLINKYVKERGIRVKPINESQIASIPPAMILHLGPTTD